MNDSWLRQPHLADYDWPLELGEAAHLLDRLNQPSLHTLGERSIAWQRSTRAMIPVMIMNYNFNNKLD